MSTGRRCPSCNAVPREGDTLYCGYCATELPPREWTPLDHPKGDTAARLAAVRADPDFERALAISVSSGGAMAKHGCAIGFALLFLGMTGFFAVAMRSFPGRGSFWSTQTFVLAIIVLIGLFVLIQCVGQAAKFARAEPRAYPAAVAQTRTEVSGGGENSSASTTYFVTLEDQSGGRTEYEVSSRVAGHLTDGDVGVAHVRHRNLLHYARFSI